VTRVFLRQTPARLLLNRQTPRPHQQLLLRILHSPQDAVVTSATHRQSPALETLPRVASLSSSTLPRRRHRRKPSKVRTKPLKLPRQLDNPQQTIRSARSPRRTRRTMSSQAKVPKPGPAKLTARAGLDEWLEQAKQCKYLPESAMKQLCEMVKECLMEGKSSPRNFTSNLLTKPSRKQHSTCQCTCNNMRRYSWPVLRSFGAFPRRWWYAW